MKTIMTSALLILSLSAFAHEIEGTLMLKGSLKTKLTVKGISTTCKLKVEKVKNLLEEDDFGNPGYQARVQVSLDGSDFERNIKVKLDKEVMLTNMQVINGKRMVSDTQYASEAGDVKVVINNDGRLVSTTFLYESKPITCNF